MITAALAWSPRVTPRHNLPQQSLLLLRLTAQRWVPNAVSFRLYSSSSSDNNHKKRVVFLGTPEVAATTLRSIHEDSIKEGSCYDLVGVVTQPPKARGRKKDKLEPSPVALVAEELGIPAMWPVKANDKEFLDNLESEVKPDLCITAAYGQYLPKRFLATPTFGTANIHPSLLPRWRGASPVQRALEAGDQPLGVTVLFTVSKMDAGPIIAQKEEHVDENDTATNLLPHLFSIGTDCLLEAMPKLLSGEITMETAKEQDEDAVVNADMIASSEAELQVWEMSAKACHDRLRGFSMWPGVFIYVQVIGEDGESVGNPFKMKIHETRVIPEPQDPTNVIALGPTKKDGLRLVCGDGSVLEMLRVQPAGKKAMDAKSFVNGYPKKTIQWVKPEPASD
ncbi:Methionyl-tRNA formyltransferase [Seminavis robusta]|uniref:Methionyl-tRNA formyltransferase, mitochondrial n=1 Tax=Seminavis robusta TaxID=568900 RepID=A0A9N8EQA2_9STRA|nr:Methionyl-tRNA formyltransferase [Seminavis robusta]|eukprot:Sro1542_g281050.1 Methionyl-tRNA formyltransferase (394) ;mRNA; r:11279-12624